MPKQKFYAIAPTRSDISKTEARALLINTPYWNSIRRSWRR